MEHFDFSTVTDEQRLLVVKAQRLAKPLESFMKKNLFNCHNSNKAARHLKAAIAHVTSAICFYPPKK